MCHLKFLYDKNFNFYVINRLINFIKYNDAVFFVPPLNRTYIEHDQMYTTSSINYKQGRRIGRLWWIRK